MNNSLTLVLCATLAVAGCASSTETTGTPVADSFAITELGTFDEPWAMAFLPDGRLLVTERGGQLQLRASDGNLTEVGGVPAVAYGGQGGLGDVAVHPGFARNGLIYLSYAESGETVEGDTKKDEDTDPLYGAAIARARLVQDGDAAAHLADLQVIWRQTPKVAGQGHYGHRLAFGADRKLWVSSGERQKFDPAQDLQANLGKILRLNDDGSVPPDNPFADQGGVAAQVWSMGHRNPLGLAFDVQGQLWNSEMGPKGGDELNRVLRGANYGYPIVSNGDHYDDRDIPDHPTRPEFAAPAVWWAPVISPSSLLFYSGAAFPQWRGQAFIGGLSSQALVRVEFSSEGAREAGRYAMGERIREVEQAADGSLWVLEDGEDARLLRLAARD